MEQFLDHCFDCDIISGRIHFDAAYVPCAYVCQIFKRADLVPAWFYDLRLL